MEYNNEAKLKEQNSSRLTDSKKQLPKGRGRGVRCGGREKGIKGHYDYHTLCRGGSMQRQYRTEKTSSDSIASYYADGW